MIEQINLETTLRKKYFKEMESNILILYIEKIENKYFT